MLDRGSRIAQIGYPLDGLSVVNFVYFAEGRLDRFPSCTLELDTALVCFAFGFPLYLAYRLLSVCVLAEIVENELGWLARS